MNVNRLCFLVCGLECSEQKELTEAENKILSELDDYKLLLKKNDSGYYVLDEIVSRGTLAFIEFVFTKIPKLPKRNSFYEHIAYNWDYSGRIINILNVLEDNELGVDEDKYGLMIKLLSQSYYNCDFETIEYLISKGGDIDYSGTKNKDSTILMEQAAYGNFKNVIRLVELGADPNKNLADGSSALLFASGKQLPDKINEFFSYSARLETLKVLLAYKVNINQCTGKKGNALFYLKREKTQLINDHMLYDAKEIKASCITIDEMINLLEYKYKDKTDYSDN